ARIVFNLRGSGVIIDAAKQTLSCRGVTAPLGADDGRIQLQILIDRGSLEIFGNHGHVALSVGAIASPDHRAATLRAEGGTAKIVELEVRDFRSIWSK